MYRDEIYFKNGLVSDSLIYQLDEHSHNQVQVLENFSFYEDRAPSKNTVELNERLIQLLNSDEMFISAQVLDKKGILIHTTSKDKSNLGLDLSLQPFITVLNQPGDFFYSNTFFSKDYNKVLASLSFKSELNYYIVYLDLDNFANHINQLPIKDQLEYVLLDHNGTIVSSSLDDLVETRSKFSFYEKSYNEIYEFEYVSIEGTNYLMNDSISQLMEWTIIILNDSNKILMPIYIMVLISIAISVTMIIITIVFQNRRVSYITHKISELNTNLKLIRKGVYDVVFLDSQFDEFAELGGLFIESTQEIQLREEEILSLNANLESLVKERTSELTDKNDELETVIEELKNTQNLLIESEKSASFSRLIAGVAHEINTPIGVCVTLSSYLISTSEKIEKAYHNNELSKGKFTEYLNKIMEISNLLLDNLEKSAELITSFKSASNNNFSYDLSEFDVYELINNLVMSLTTQIKKKNIVIEMNLESPLIIRGYPSAMSQIVTNLISNAIVHGFKGKDEGKIVITAYKKNSNLILSVEDNGKGISKVNEEDIFEPFFTTNRASGGMGLGLSIIQNLVVNKLMGSVNVSSKENEFTRFELTIPNEKLVNVE